MAGRHVANWLILGAVVILATSGFGGLRVQSDEGEDFLRAEWPECPHRWDTIWVAKSKHGRIPGPTRFVLGAAGTSVARSKTNVPEFHDCQRIILPDGRTYGPLMAVFAAFDLGPRKFPPLDSAAAEMMAAAEVFNDSATYTYEPLGIGPKFNCLYIVRVRVGDKETLRAKMIKVGDNEQSCAERINVLEAQGKELLVRETLKNRYADTAYPPVARWDWDAVHKEQYIGLKCGAAWCEVGRPREGAKPAFVSSPTYLSPPATLTPDARVRVIKGWYDQQILAVETGVLATPGSVVGTFFPAPNLKTLTEASFSGTWVPVGYVALLGRPGIYKGKFNFDRVIPPGRPLNVMNEMSFCVGTRSRCNIPVPFGPSVRASCGNEALAQSEDTERWWVRIKSAPDAGPTRYIFKCVERRGHPGADFDIPGTARWRWLADDETEWEYCPTNFCCETKTKA